MRSSSSSPCSEVAVDAETDDDAVSVVTSIGVADDEVTGALRGAGAAIARR